MQTFLPYESFKKSAKVLDYKRLGKQRVETIQILNALKALRENDLYTTDKNGKVRKRGWLNHSCTRMWQGHDYWLCLYNIVICEEWISRGYKDTCLDKTVKIFRELPTELIKDKPYWLGDSKLHLSHRSRLAQKDPNHYLPLFEDADMSMEYVWFSSERTSHENI